MKRSWPFKYGGKNEQTCYSDEVEIDLIQFIKRICVQWRAVVAVALIFALAVMGAKYAKDYRVYETSEREKNQLPMPLEDIESGVSDEEKMQYIWR